MRTDCKNYESRTYASGEVVRMCRKDLAPEAPWKCPENCPGYERKLAGAGFVSGSLADKGLDREPPQLDENTAALLDSAEDIINAVGPDIIAEIEAQRAAEAKRAATKRSAFFSKWWPLKRR